ncbi:MAG: hypothetical protein K0R49_975 [Burkholderiales bacterium]|nr:hypothetical protein [Burkholderiales bacterium]
MQVKYIGLSIFIIIILIIQLIVNNTTILYIDCLTLIMVALLLDGLCSNRFLLVASLLADLLGHWYLGTHLLAITLVSFPAKGLVNFYRVSNFLQKIVLNGIFALIAYLLIGSIDALAHKSGISWKNLLVEIVILNPIILLMLSTVIVKLPSDIIRTE